MASSNPICFALIAAFQLAAATAMAQTAPATPPAPSTPAAASTPYAPAQPAEVKTPLLKQAEPAPSPADPFAQFAWLEGCWRGVVNARDFREYWLPPRGSLMIGASHTVAEGKTIGYEYLRIEPRGDGLYYVNAAMGPGQKETAYKLVDRAMDKDDEVFTFASGGQEFPQQILYRHNATGWLYATVAGKINGVDKQVIYPMHRINCETGEGIKR
jgi:hypothetical protein